MVRQGTLNKLLTIFIVLLVTQSMAIAQTTCFIERPRIDVLDSVFFDLVDFTKAEMDRCGYSDSHSYFFYIFELKREGGYHCWLLVHPFSHHCLTELPERWDEGVEVSLFWPEGYFYFEGVLCLVRTSYPGVNFSFSDQIDKIPFPIESNDIRENDDVRCNWLMLMYASQTEKSIKRPFYVELGCDRMLDQDQREQDH